MPTPDDLEGDAVEYLRRRAEQYRAQALREGDVARAAGALNAATLFDREAARLSAGR